MVDLDNGSPGRNGGRGVGWNRLLERVAPNLWETIAIAVGVLVLVWVTLRLRAWFRDDAASDDNDIDLLSDMRDLHREGGLTDEEFRSIKTRLAQAATGGGASRQNVSTTPRTPATAAADSAADRTTATSLNGRSDPPDQGLIGPTATDATEEGPGRATS
jgi:hypothetical protein